MQYLFRGRIAPVWLGLTLVTLASWWISVGRGQAIRPDLAVTMAVIVIAVIKARFVLREFMEVRHASRWLRLLSDVWVVGLPVAVFIGLTV
ncbi:MAG: prokaryotic cytochrome C oxidase subunit IV family protein [Alphaproteobacteria bacterium]|nr:MAG: prokaryotic cytochrome C oxidase subunit IV family protein [Alphaproteobacteria bacterium]